MDFPNSTAEQVVLIHAATLDTITVGSTKTIGPLDMRGYNSWYLTCTVTNTSGLQTLNTARIGYEWDTIDTTFFPGTVRTMTERTEIFSGGTIGGYGRSGQLRHQDQVHGPFLTITIYNVSAAESLDVFVSVSGTTRVITFPHSYQAGNSITSIPSFGSDDILFNDPAIAVPAFPGTTIPLPMYWGRIGWHFEAITNPVQIVIGWGSDGANLLNYGIYVAGTVFDKEYVFPRRPAIVTLIATAGAATARMFITTQRDKT